MLLIIKNNKYLIIAVIKEEKTAYQEYLEEKGTPDVLLGRFGSGSTERLANAINEIWEKHKDQNDANYYPRGIVWSSWSTAAYLADKDAYPTVMRSLMSDNSLATMFADWLFTNIKTRRSEYPNINKTINANG